MKKIALIIFLAFGALSLSACSGGGGLVANWPGLAADAEQAYISSGSFVHAVDLKSGKEVWRYPAKADSKLIFFATPVITPDGQLLIGSEGTNHALVSIDTKTGRDNWTTPFSGAKGPWVAAPLMLNDRIYAPNTDGFVYVLDQNGQLVGDPIQIGGALWSTPSTDGTFLYVTSLDHHFHVIDPSTSIQKDPIDLGGAAPSSPVIGEDGVYVGSFASKIEFVKPNGDHKVIAKATNWVWGAPALDGKTLYYADLNGNVFSFDIASGTQNWGNVKPDGPIVAGPLVKDNQIYIVSEDGSLIIMDKDGKYHAYQVGGKIYTSPVASGNLVLVAPYQAEFALAAFDADGKQAWTFIPAK
jgi:outer membrane protein assembly factor BamB